MRRILFVDDESFILQALERMFRNMRNEWEMRFAESGARALEMMADRPADVVVSDMRMPRMDGGELLNEIKNRHPKTVRIILSGYADAEMILQCIGGTHQFLSKPCKCDTLRGVITRALELGEWINNEGLKSLVSRLEHLPSPPTLYFKIMRELNKPDGMIEQVCATISEDPAMTAKILQLANSAFFGIRQKITDPSEAALQLGMETIKSLVLGIHVFSQFEGGHSRVEFVEHLWRHSISTAARARRIALLEHQTREVVEDSFTAGLLHDLGRLLLIANLPEQYEKVIARSRAEEIPLLDAEREEFGGSHAEIGGYLLGLWGLPVSLVEAAVFHHSPARSKMKTFAALTAVHVANVLEHEATSRSLPGADAAIDPDYLKDLGLINQLKKWREPAPGPTPCLQPNEKNTFC